MKNKEYLKRLLFILALFCVSLGHPCVTNAQQEIDKLAKGTADTTCIQRDIADVIREALNKPPKVDTTNAGSILLVPIIGSNPATGFMFGVGGQYAFKPPGSATRYSMLSGSIQFTTKNQQLYLLKNNVYTKNNNIFFTGDWRYLIFSQSTYGLGTNAPEGGILDYQFNLAGLETSDDSLAQPLKFNFLRFLSIGFVSSRENILRGRGILPRLLLQN